AGIFHRSRKHAEGNVEQIADFPVPGKSAAKIIAETTFKAVTDPYNYTCHICFPKFRTCPDNKSPGEYWLCAGQSNMQKGWNEFNATQEEKERVKREMARLEKLNVWLWDFNDNQWTKLTPENALRKSAFGVSFAIRRAEETGKAIFMLYVAAGGAPTESFLSEQTMCAMGKDGKPLYPHLAAIATNRHRLDQNKDFPCAWVAREYPRRRTNREEACWWPVSLMYDYGIKRIKGGEVQIDGILWYQGESNATTCVAPDKPTDRDYQLETLRALVSELSSLFPASRSSSAALAKEDSPLPVPRYPFIMMGLPKMNRPWSSIAPCRSRFATRRARSSWTPSRRDWATRTTSIRATRPSLPTSPQKLCPTEAGRGATRVLAVTW
ncbi:MAG: hypothetical protein IKO55_00565, partial [Kiritimatiellae bacterium]|nr:hypothetical protein [Kiritimatiellia bacterium]